MPKNLLPLSGKKIKVDSSFDFDIIKHKGLEGITKGTKVLQKLILV